MPTFESPSLIEIPKEASPPQCVKDKEKTQEDSPELSLARRKGKRKDSKRSECSQERSSVKEADPNKRVKSQNLSVSKSKFPLLIDPSLNKIFYEKWSSRPIGVGRYYDFDKLESDKIFVKQYPDKLGWVPFLQIREIYHTEAIQVFYLMAECYPDKDLIVSKIKGVKIHITLEEISNILNIPISGSVVFGDEWYNALGLDYDYVCKAIFKPNAPDHTYSSLLPTTKILANMCHYSLLPKNGSYDQISRNDILLIYHMFKGIPLNLPHISIQNMMLAAQNSSKKGTLPYGMALANFFKELNVSLDDELSSFKFSTFTPKNVHQMKDESEIHIPSAENVSHSQGIKRKRENPISMEHLFQCLQPELEPPRESFPVSKEHARLLDNFAKNPIFPKFQNMVEMQSFFGEAAPANKVSDAAPLYVSPPKHNYSALYQSESIDKFFMDPSFYESSIPLKSYHNMQSTSPSFNVLTGASPPLSMDGPPPKKTKTERKVRKIRKDVLKLFEAFHGIMKHTVYDSMESTCLRQW